MVFTYILTTHILHTSLRPPPPPPLGDVEQELEGRERKGKEHSELLKLTMWLLLKAQNVNQTNSKSNIGGWK